MEWYFPLFLWETRAFSAVSKWSQWWWRTVTTCGRGIQAETDIPQWLWMGVCLTNVISHILKIKVISFRIHINHTSVCQCDWKEVESALFHVLCTWASLGSFVLFTVNVTECMWACEMKDWDTWPLKGFHWCISYYLRLQRLHSNTTKNDWCCVSPVCLWIINM